MAVAAGKAVKTTCPYCGVGCGVAAAPDGRGAAGIKGDVTHPANFGRLCSKGSALGETLDLDGRLLYPEIGGERVSWGAALDRTAAEFGRIRAQHGPGAIAFYLSGQLLTEDYYIANKLAKGFIGTPHVDTNSRLCMASSVAGHKRAFGADAVPQCYEDLDGADLIVLAGSNAAWCHPILYQRIHRARETRGARVVNIDPRRTPTSEGADLHLSIAPGMDAILWQGLLVWLADEGALDDGFIARHTEGFAEALAAARRHAPCVAEAARRTGLAPSDVETFYRWWADTPRVVSCYSQGVNQSAQGTDKVSAILNCHLAAGRIGKPGCGPLSLTGQPNAMGGREAGGMANMLAAHMGFSEEERDRVRRFWGAPNLVEGEGLKAVQMFEAIARGEIKALWVMGSNPAVSLPDADAARRALQKLELFVISENVAANDTADLAHIRLPAAAWGEKDGTVTNSERCISRQRAFLPLPAEARPDWAIVASLAARLGWGRAFDYSGPADIFREHAALSGFENDGRRAFDISRHATITAEDYKCLQPFQWPARRCEKPVKRLFADARFYTPSRRARFAAVDEARLAAPADEDWPFTLNTGRIRDQWHTMTRTAKSARLSAHIAEPYVEIHPEDAASCRLEHGHLAKVATGYGAAVLRVQVNAGQRRGSLFAPIHWSGANSAAARIGGLTQPIVDAVSGQPEAKATPAAVAPFCANYHGVLLSRQAAKPDNLSYWSQARMTHGYAMHFAGDAPASGWAAWTARQAGEGDMLSIIDEREGVWRAAVMRGGRLMAAMFAARSPALPPLEWVKAAFGRDRLEAAERKALLSGRAPALHQDEGAIVCVCFQVGARRIQRAVGAGATTVAQIGAALKAGSNCGSCLPELRLICARAEQAIAAE